MRRPIRLIVVALLGAIALGVGASVALMRAAPDATAPLAPADAIVVLGCRALPDGSPSLCLRRRADHALALWRAGAAPLLVTTGGTESGPVAEGDAAAARLMQAGVPPDALRVERQATSTSENADGIAALVPGARLILVTDAPHAWRAACVFRAQFPAVAVSPVHRPWTAELSMAAREVAAVGLYALTGRLGPCLGGGVEGAAPP